MTQPPADPPAPDPWAGQPGWGDTDPAGDPNPYAAAPGYDDRAWAGRPPAGFDPGAWSAGRGADPAAWSGAAQWYHHPPLPRRPWYRAPGSLVGAATFSAVCAWVTVAAALAAREISLAMDSADPFEALLFGLFAIFGLVVAGAIGVASFLLTVGGAAATVPLAVVWFRDPRRSTAAGIALAHAVVSWAAMAAAIVWIP